MEEVIPVASGVVLGLAVAHLASGPRQGWTLGGMSLPLGLAVSWITGELAVSWIYVLIDTAQVLAAGAMTRVLAARWRRVRSAARRSA